MGVAQILGIEVSLFSASTCTHKYFAVMVPYGMMQLIGSSVNLVNAGGIPNRPSYYDHPTYWCIGSCRNASPGYDESS